MKFSGNSRFIGKKTWTYTEWSKQVIQQVFFTRKRVLKRYERPHVPRRMQRHVPTCVSGSPQLSVAVLHQILTDFHISFTDTLGDKFAVNIIEDTTTPQTCRYTTL